MLSSSKYEQVPLKNDSESLDNFARSNNEEANAFGTCKEVCKLFSGMGWYIGTVEYYRYQFDGSKTYTVRLEDGEYEEWSNE